MVENYTLTVEKEFMTRLRNVICCSEGMGTCDGGDFCSTNPEDWPTITNGHKMVSLSQPANKKSIPGIDQFRDKYMKWNRANDCINLLAKFDGLSTGLALFSDTQSLKEKLSANDEICGTTDDKNQAALNAAEISLKKRCPILYDEDEAGIERFNPARVEDLKKIDEFLMIASTPPEDGNGFHWKDIFKGGGILSAGSFLVWLLYKIVGFGKKGKGHLNESSFIIRGIGDGINSLASAIKYVFGTSLPNLGRSLLYVASFKWAKGEKAPENLKPREPDVTQTTGIDPLQNETVPGAREKIDIKPHPDVVLAQLCALVGSEHHAMEGKRFANLTDDGKRYLADLAVKRWSSEPESRQQVFAEDDDRLTEGKLPNEFLFKFARHYLKKDSNLDILEASARVWAQQIAAPRNERSELPLISEFSPRLIDIKRQLLNDAHFQNAGAEAREYIAMLAKAEWDALSDGAKRSFITVNDAPETGALPQKFIRTFRKKSVRNLDDINLKSKLREVLAATMPSALECPFNILDKRLSSIIKAWKNLPDEIKMSFETASNHRPGVSEIPPYFIEYIFKVISIGHLARIPSLPAEKEWKLSESPDLSYQSHSLSDVMENVALLNEKLRMHPELLKARAQSVIDGWALLESEVRKAFVNNDDTQEMRRSAILKEGLDLVPKNFTAFIHKFSLGIATSQRPHIKKDDGGQNGGSSAKASSAGQEAQGKENQDCKDADAAMVAMHAIKSRRNVTAADQRPSDATFIRSKYIAAMKSARASQMQQANPVIGAAAVFVPTLQPQPIQMMPQLQPAMIRIR